MVGVYNRVQKLKSILKQIIAEDKNIQINLMECARNKILIVTHSVIMKALTASQVRFNHQKSNSFDGPFDLIDGFHFENCEIYPQYLPINYMSLLLQDFNDRNRGEKKDNSAKNQIKNGSMPLLQQPKSPVAGTFGVGQLGYSLSDLYQNKMEL